MSKVITFSRVFPKYHPKAGQPTYFVEQIYNSLFSKNNLMDYPKGLEIDDTIMGVKKHTIRNGNRWKVGDKFSPRVWSGKPYASKQIILADDVEVKKVFDFIVEGPGYILNGYAITLTELKILAENDGLEADDLGLWFNKPGKFQVICWNENLQYKMSDGKFIF
jgi:hypothetical protein